MKSRILIFALVGAISIGVQSAGRASTILGTGTGALLGGDLTDPEDDGIESPLPQGSNFNATFFASDKPTFEGGEGAFNVFDNTVGGGNAKWCCGTAFPQIVGADFGDDQFVLTHFTVTSGNDTPERRPVDWTIEGSNDTTTGLDGTWTTIFSHSGSSVWTAHDQVILFSPADGDTFLVTDQGFSAFRMVTTATGATSGAFFQLGEIEFFGTPFVAPVPEPSSVAIWAIIGIALGGFGWWRVRKK